MATTVINRNAQRAQAPHQETCAKSARNGNSQSCQVNNYLKTREGLWRLLALFPPTTSVVEAVRNAPALLTSAEKGGKL